MSSTAKPEGHSSSRPSQSTSSRGQKDQPRRQTSPLSVASGQLSQASGTTSTDKIRVSSAQPRVSSTRAHTSSVMDQKPPHGADLGPRSGRRGSNGNGDKTKHKSSNREALTSSYGMETTGATTNKTGSRSHATVSSKYVPKAQKVPTPPSSPPYQSRTSYNILPSHLDVSTHKPHDDHTQVGPAHPYPPTSLGVHTHPTESPYSSGNISSGELHQHGQATPSMDSTTAKVVGTNNSFDVERGTMKPKSSNIPRVLNTTTALPDTLAPGEGARAYSAPVPANMAVSSRDEQTRDELLSQNSAEASDEDAGGKMLLPGRSIGVDTVKNLRSSGEKVQVRPVRKEESTGRRRHLLTGQNVSKDVTSLGERQAYQQEEYSSDGEIAALRAELANKDAQLMELSRKGGRPEDRQVEHDPLAMGNQYRQMMEDCHQLRETAKEAKKLKKDLEECRREKADRETQVMQLTTRLSLYEQSGEEGRGPRATSEVNTAALTERITTLTRELQRSEANVKKLKDHVNRVTRPTEVGEGGGEGLAVVKEGLRQRPHTSEIRKAPVQSFGADHERQLASLYEDAKQKDELITQQARELEELRGLEKKKVVELYQEIKERDEKIETMTNQLGKLEDISRKFAAVWALNEQSSSAIKSLSDKCERLQADRARLELQNTDLTSKLIHLEKSVEQSAVLAVELEEAGKKVALLGEQLEEQQISTEKLERSLKKKDEKLQKANHNIYELQQNLVLQKGLLENSVQSLHDSQKVATGLSTKFEEQMVELAKLQRARDELLGELEAQKLTAATYAEDFTQERKDREKAHSKMAEMETQYAQQFQKLADELRATQQRADQMQKLLKTSEANYQAQISQSKYNEGSREKAVATLREEKKRLEDDLFSKMQQVKQYKKQLDQHVTELTTFKDAYEAQKMQIEQMGNENAVLTRQNKALEHKNRDLEARDRHAAATGASGGRGKGDRPSVEAEKKIAALEKQVEQLQTDKAIMESQMDQFSKSATPKVPPTSSASFSSSSRDKLTHNASYSALPSRYPAIGQQGKSHSVEDPNSNSRARPGRTVQESSRFNSDNLTPYYSDHSQMPSLKSNLGHQQQAHTSHLPSHRGSSATPDPHRNNASSYHTPSSNNAESALADTHYSGTNAAYHQGGVVYSRPTHQQYNVGVAGSSAYLHGTGGGGDGGGGRGGDRQRPDLISRNYPSGSGPSSLPVSPPHHHYNTPHPPPHHRPPPTVPHQQQQQHNIDPHRGPYQGERSRARDDMDLYVGSDIVEKDSPPTSFVSSPGPASLNLQQLNACAMYSASSHRNHSQQLPRKPSAPNVGGAGRGIAQYGVGMSGVGGSFVSQTQTGSRMGQQSQLPTSTSSASRLGAVGQSSGATYQGAGSYPRQETATPISSHSQAAPSNPGLRSLAEVPNAMETSLTSVTSNQLEKGIDDEINNAADDIKNQTSVGEGVGEDAPFDPNLECPTCGRQFKIGQIQLFRQHAATCNTKK